jgi:hypothetical protein
MVDCFDSIVERGGGARIQTSYLRFIKHSPSRLNYLLGTDVYNYLIYTKLKNIRIRMYDISTYKVS